jgi:thermitase
MRAATIVGLVATLGALLWGCAGLWNSPSPAELVDSDAAPIWVAADARPASLLEAMPKGVGNQPPCVAGQLVVKLKSGKFTNAAITSLCTKQRIELKGRINSLRLLLVKLPANADLAATQAKLAAQPDVEAVSPNYVYGLFENGTPAATPKAITNDKFYLWQWAMKRIGFTNIAASVLPTTAPTVAVVDTGVDYNHPDLLGKVIKGPDYFDGDMDPMDVTGHGTHVSGIIAAINNNNLGVAGVSGSSKILAVRVGAFGIPVFAGAAGIVYAADTAGVKVINLSWGGYFRDPWTADAVAYAATKGVLVVASAGNEDTTDPAYPASYPGVLSVGATTVDYDGQDMMAYFSDYGDTVDIAAPGVEIYSTTPVAGSAWYGPSYDWSDGTSMASPLVAGAAALVRGKWSTLTAQQTSDLLTDTAYTPIMPDGDGHAFEDEVGRLDLYAAFDARLGTMPPAPGAILGIIVDANTGLALQGATVTAKSGSSTFTATTRVDGTFTITNVRPGSYSVSAAKSTYVTTPYTLANGGLADVVSGSEYLLIFIALPKTQAASVYTAVLSWVGWGISELDSFLWLPDSLPLRNQYLVGYWDRGNLNAHPFARFLRDEPTEMPSRWWGPVFAEAVVFTTKYSGQFTFAVNDYFGGADWTNTPAVVQLYKGGTLVGTYLAADASGSGVWWDVFTLNGPSGAPVAVQALMDTFPGPYGEEYFSTAGAHKPATPAGSVPFGTFVPGNQK